jgi:hypothetical protein
MQTLQDYGVTSMNKPFVKSRTGYVIFIQGCPIVWQSELQGDIATSTIMESEYNVLPCMTDMLPLLELIKIITHALGINEIGLAKF